VKSSPNAPKRACRFRPLADLIETASREKVTEAGPFWALVKNAGYLNAGRLDEVSIPDARDHLEVMVLAPLDLVQRCLPTMNKSGSGPITNVSSSAAHASTPPQRLVRRVQSGPTGAERRPPPRTRRDRHRHRAPRLPEQHLERGGAEPAQPPLPRRPARDSTTRCSNTLTVPTTRWRSPSGGCGHRRRPRGSKPTEPRSHRRGRNPPADRQRSDARQGVGQSSAPSHPARPELMRSSARTRWNTPRPTAPSRSYLGLRTSRALLIPGRDQGETFRSPRKEADMSLQFAQVIAARSTKVSYAVVDHPKS
jgi:hypothetical protein